MTTDEQWAVSPSAITPNQTNADVADGESVKNVEVAPKSAPVAARPTGGLWLAAIIGFGMVAAFAFITSENSAARQAAGTAAVDPASLSLEYKLAVIDSGNEARIKSL